MAEFVQLYGDTVKLRNVKSMIAIEMNLTLHTKLYGCVYGDFGISSLPPKMITKLDAEGVENYVKYGSESLIISILLMS